MKNLLFVFIFILLSSALYSTIINVPTPYTSIQAGIDAAANADTVLVQPGTYVENINYNGKLITVASLYLTTADTSYISSTIIDGNSSGSVVTFTSGEDSTAVLCGFTITNGSYSGGGGIYCSNASPSLINLMISGNSSQSSSGGGIHCRNNSNPSLENVIISNNTAQYGGGIYCHSSSPSFKYVTILGNTAERAGGIYCQSNSNPNLEYVTISGNTATVDYGGGIFCMFDSSPSLEYVTISDNYANTFGGGISCYLNCFPSLTNVTITDNIASDGGGIYCYNSIVYLTNSISWNDEPEEFYFHSGQVNATYSDIQSGYVGTGNISSDPLFINPSSGDYHLQLTSPCIDIGDPTFPLDPDGSRSDMGAYYFDQSINADFTVDVTDGYAPLLVNFTDLSRPGIGGVVDEWFWDFGDGNNSSLQNPSNEYLLPGIYTVSLTVIDDIDSTNTETKIDYITVFGSDPPAPPTNVLVDIVYPDAVISWTAVDTTMNGDPCAPDGYVVLYSENEEDYFYLWFTTEVSFIHEFVAQHSTQMFYQVVTFIDLSRENIQYLNGLNNSHHKIKWLDVKRNLKRGNSVR